MTTDHRRVDVQMAQEVLLDDPSFLREIVERVVQQILEAEMSEHIGAAPYERTTERKGHRNGHKPRTLRTRVGTLNLLVPQDREGTFSTRLFSRYQRNEKALVLTLMEMYAVFPQPPRDPRRGDPPQCARRGCRSSDPPRTAAGRARARLRSA